jgi:ParB-like chromosome segregation protein Spo0J
MDAATPLPDFDAMRRAIEKAGREAMHPDSENRLDLFKRAIREVLEIRADAMRSGIYFKDPEVKLKAYETRSRAERRIAQFLMAMDEAGLRDPGHPKKGEKGRKASAPSGLPTLTDLGIDRHDSQRWQRLGRMSHEEFEAWLETELAKKSQRRSRRRKGPLDYPLHPITNDYADFTEEELTALRMSLRERGLVVPIVIWCNQTVDGKHRAKLCREEGITLRYRDITKQCPTEGDMRAYVKALNEHRRANTKPLTAAEKRARTEAAIMADPTRSDRQIADEIGVSPTTAGKVRSDLEAKGDVSKMDTRVDTSGRWQRARKAKPAEPAKGRRHRPRAADTTHDDTQPGLPLVQPQETKSSEPISVAPEVEPAPSNQPVEIAPPPDPIRLDVAAVIGAVAVLDRLPDDFDFTRMTHIVDVSERPHLRGRVSRGMDALNALWDALSEAIGPTALAEQDPSLEIIDDSLEISEQMPPLPE